MKLQTPSVMPSFQMHQYTPLIEKFTPFINERDSMNRIIGASSKMGKGSSPISYIKSYSTGFNTRQSKVGNSPQADREQSKQSLFNILNTDRIFLPPSTDLRARNSVGFFSNQRSSKQQRDMMLTMRGSKLQRHLRSTVKYSPRAVANQLTNSFMKQPFANKSPSLEKMINAMAVQTDHLQLNDIPKKYIASKSYMLKQRHSIADNVSKLDFESTAQMDPALMNTLKFKQWQQQMQNQLNRKMQEKVKQSEAMIKQYFKETKQSQV